VGLNDGVKQIGHSLLRSGTPWSRSKVTTSGWLYGLGSSLQAQTEGQHDRGSIKSVVSLDSFVAELFGGRRSDLDVRLRVRSCEGRLRGERTVHDSCLVVVAGDEIHDAEKFEEPSHSGLRVASSAGATSGAHPKNGTEERADTDRIDERDQAQVDHEVEPGSRKVIHGMAQGYRSGEIELARGSTSDARVGVCMDLDHGRLLFDPDQNADRPLVGGSGAADGLGAGVVDVG
jgi:hypothetical protein